MCVYAFRMNLLHAYTKFTRVFCMHAQKFELFACKLNARVFCFYINNKTNSAYADTIA